MDIRLYWLWLRGRLGLGNPKTAALLREWEHPRRLYEADEETLSGRGIRGALLETLSDKSLDEARRIADTVQELDIWMLTPDDAAYPQALLSLPDMPTVLFGNGDFPEDWDQRLSIGVVGTRKISDTGRKLTAALTAGLCAGGATVVTGVADGSDETVISMAIACHGVCVAVLACGLNVNYPQSTEALRRRLTEKGGVLLSEYAPFERGTKGCYHTRNRLISGLTAGTLVTEAPKRSGALITAHWAREQGRDVFAVPGDAVSSAGCHQLIREGALLVTSSVEVLEEYEMRYTELPDCSAAVAAERDVLRKFRQKPEVPLQTKPVRVRSVSALPRKQAPVSLVRETPFHRPAMPQGLSENARTLFPLLGEQPIRSDELAVRGNLSTAAVLSAMTELEMLGLVENHAGGQYRLKG